LQEASLDFEFLSGSALTNLELTELKRATSSLIVKYNKDINTSEFCLELESFKHQVQNLLPHVESATTVDLCQLIQNYIMGAACYPNMETALCIFYFTCCCCIMQ
jgi:hypothetical protein